MNDQGPIYVKMPDEADLKKFMDMLDDQSFIGTLAPVEYCTSCLVCGESIPVSMWENHVKICEDCKKAIKFIKEKFKEDLND
jgi:hypothetical protein